MLYGEMIRLIWMTIRACAKPGAVRASLGKWSNLSALGMWGGGTGEVGTETEAHTSDGLE